MSLPLSIFESCDVLQPEETSPFDPLLLQARTVYYDYVSLTAKAQWQLEHYVNNDLVQLECQHERQTTKTQRILVMDPVGNDLDSRVGFAINRDQEERAEKLRRTTQSSRQSTPLGFYVDEKRYSVEYPQQTTVKFPAEEGLQAGWLGDAFHLRSSGDTKTSDERAEKVAALVRAVTFVHRVDTRGSSNT
jgi:hypothetical protein